jgi:hypothetical protein
MRGSKILHNEELDVFAGHLLLLGEMAGRQEMRRNYGGKICCESQPGMLRRRREYNITLALRDMCYGDGRWNELTQNLIQWRAAVLLKSIMRDYSRQGQDYCVLLRFQTSSEAYPASCPLGTWEDFPGGKAAGERNCPPTST